MSMPFQPSRLHLPTEQGQIGYLAGLFDGEGCLLLNRNTNGWRLIITSTDFELATWLVTLGGCLRKKVRYSPRHSAAYDWYLERGAEVQAFLHLVSPYLRIKAPRAYKALADLERRIPRLEVAQ